MKLTKIVAVVATLAVASAAVFAEGLSVGGYFRSGAEFDLDEDNMQTESFNDGYYYGYGSSRLRVNVTYENEAGGATFRFQKSDDLEKYWFADFDPDTETGGDVKWAMAYANLFDGKAVVEAGLLTDRFTTTGGDWDSGFDGTKGARLVLFPVEGLTLTAQASRLLAEDEDDAGEDDTAVKTNKKIGSFSAKYETEDFFVVGGYHLAESAYGSIGLTSIENLTAVFEMSYDNSDDNSDTDPSIMYAGTLSYAKDAFEVGVIGYYNTFEKTSTDSTNSYEVYPFASYALNDTYTASLEASFADDNGKTADNKDTEIEVTVTPAITINATKSAQARVYYTYAKEGNSSAGVTVKMAF